MTCSKTLVYTCVFSNLTTPLNILKVLNFSLDWCYWKRTVLYLDLIHVHNSPGGSLSAQAVADPLVQSHAIELTVVRCLPPYRSKQVKKKKKEDMFVTMSRKGLIAC